MLCNCYKHRGVFFLKNDAFMGSPAQMTITISAAPKFCTQGRSECPEMSRLDPIHRGFVKVKPFRGLRWGLRGPRARPVPPQGRPGAPGGPGGNSGPGFTRLFEDRFERNQGLEIHPWIRTVWSTTRGSAPPFPARRGSG